MNLKGQFDILNAIVAGKPGQWWLRSDNRWMDCVSIDDAIMRFRQGCELRIKPDEPAPLLERWYVVDKDGLELSALIAWLDAKWARHKEIEDKYAADKLREYAALLAKANEGAPEKIESLLLTIDQDDIDCTYHASVYVENLEAREQHFIAQCVALRKQLAEREAEVGRLRNNDTIRDGGASAKFAARAKV